VDEKFSPNFIIPSSNAAKILEAVESIFNQMPVGIADVIVDNLPLAVGSFWYHGSRAALPNGLSKSVRVIPVISEQMLAPCILGAINLNARIMICKN
jgi:hypothetical protein